MQHNSNLVIFGVTGNLAKLKIIPALYDLITHGKLSDNSLIIGIGRKDFSHESFCVYINDIIAKTVAKSGTSIDQSALDLLSKKLRYVQGDAADSSMYEKLQQTLAHDSAHPNTIFYLATYPSLYETIFQQLKLVGLNTNSKGWVRIMVEKPIGSDESSARELNQVMRQYFEESQIYRLDHYLGKETVQNILFFRFGNSIFEPIFNHEYVDHIQITSTENFGIGERGMYYDNVGALKDVGQNHLLQMLSLITMDAPENMSNEAVTAERLKVLKSLQANPESLVLGQYEGYLSEKSVNPASITNTFFALKTEVRTSRFAGVPIYLRAGKMLQNSVAEISIVFKKPVNQLFGQFECPDVANVLIFRIQPDEGIALRFLSKKPLSSNVLHAANMEFCYKSVSSKLLNPYESLINDALAGDQTFFNDAEEVEAQWQFIDQLTVAHKQPVIYPAGSMGPQEATDLIEKDGRKWLESSEHFCKL